MDLRLEKLAIETILAARDLSKAAGEARREAWRYFGGSGCGWHRLALVGPFWGFWRRF